MIDQKVGKYELFITHLDQNILFCPIPGIPTVEIGDFILLNGLEYEIVKVEVDIIFIPNQCTQIILVVD